MPSPHAPLHRKLALVTGASRGIGAAVAQRLALDGAAVLVHYHQRRDAAQGVVDAIRAAGGEAELTGADLSALDGPNALIQQMSQAFAGRFAQRVDILINNAGTFEYEPLLQATDASFDRMFNLNVRAVFQLSRHAAAGMQKAGWGRIVNIGSVFGQAVPIAGMGGYSASKFAVQGFTRAWSRDVGGKGLTVNNVQPALIQPEPAPTSGATFDAMQRFASVGRFGKAADVAAMVAFLAGPDAAYINGQSFCVDGGWSA
jgi:3-oxoacyl-[acyl-carrier protein] reductase